MTLRNVRYRVVSRGGKRIRIAFSKSTGKAREVKVLPKRKKRG